MSQNRIKSSPDFNAQPTGLCLWRGWLPGTTGYVFNARRLLTGQVGFVVAGLVAAAIGFSAYGLFSTQEGILRVLGVVMIVFAVAGFVFITICTNSLVARSVVVEVSENRAQDVKEGWEFIKRNMWTLLIYPYVFMAVIVIAAVISALLMIVLAIPEVGPLIYDVLLFPLSLVLGIGSIVAATVLQISGFVFPAFIAVEETTLNQTTRGMIRLVKARWLRLAGSQAVAFAGALFLHGIFSLVCVWGVVLADSVSSMLEQVFDTGGGRRGGPDILQLLGHVTLLNPMQLLDLMIGEAPIRSFWGSVLVLSVVSFIPTYMAVAGALTYLSIRSPAPVTAGIEKQSSDMTPVNSSVAHPRLVDVGGALNNREFDLVPEGLKIGRSSECDIVVLSDHVSREHVWIGIGSKGKIVVRDLNSTNGTFVEGRRVTEIEVESGCEVRLGADQAARFLISV